MPRSAELICIDPAQVHQFWPYVAPFIAAAMRRGRISDFAGVAGAVHAGRSLVWIALTREDGRERPDGTREDGRERPDRNRARIKAAAVTELGNANGERFCTIVACGATGHDRAEWLPLLAGLEDYARAERCTAMRIWGRRGWERLLPDYKPTRVILEKELHNEQAITN